MLRSTMLWRHRPAPRRALLLLALLALALGGQPSARSTQADSPAVLLKDAVPGAWQLHPSASVATPLATVGDTFFFVNYDFNNGDDLWKSDGTPAGTALVKDVFPGRAAGSFQEPVAAGGLLFFLGSSDTGPQTLWRSDGTAAGTFQLKAAGPERLSYILDLTAAGGSLFFLNLSPDGLSLWKSDGAEAGTLKVADLASDTIEDTYGLVGAGARLFFVSADSAHGRELWQSDGTAVGTAMVADLNPGGDAFPTRHPEEGASLQMTPAGSAVFFSATDGAKGGLWRSQGGGIDYLADLAFDGGIPVGAELYFSTTAGELCKTDGTPAGTAVIRPGLVPGSLTRFGGQVFFLNLLNGSLGGGELWKTDGSEAGTLKVRDASPVAFTFVAAGGPKLFLFGLSNGQREVWVSDGTDTGTGPLKDFNPAGDDAAAYLAVLGGKLLLSASDKSGPALWASDGTGAGTQQLKNTLLVNNGLVDWSAQDTAHTAVVGGQLFFAVGAALWRSDGTPAGTRALKTIGVFDQDSISLERASGGLLFFSAVEGGAAGLWRSDGTAEGTLRLKQFSGLVYGPAGGVSAQGLFYFFTGSAAEYQIWRSDGTAAGTLPLVSLARGQSPAAGDFPKSLTATGGRLFFTFNDGAHGRELWVSDGTQAGTRMVKDLNQGAADADPLSLTDLNGALVFVVSASADGGFPARGYSLWKSDGSADGTLLLAQFDYGLSGRPRPAPGWLTSSGPRLFFTAWDGETGDELWVSDGTPAGTRQLKDINAEPNSYYDGSPDLSKNDSSAPHDLAVVGGTLVFAADDGPHGDELWKSDGTAAGTVLVTDLYPGTLGSKIGTLRALPRSGRVVFAGSDGLSGVELWSSDGTAAGTQLLSDIAAGAPSSNPTDLLPGERQLFFLADDGQTGAEPWALSLSARAQVFLPLVRK